MIVGHPVRAPGALRALLAGAIDYAGLFPPAKLSMGEAVANYASYRRDDASWALGRFVVPASRIDELLAARRELPGGSDDSGIWGASVLFGADVAADGARARSLDPRSGVRVDAVELRASSPDEIRSALREVPPGVEAYVEVPLDVELTPLLDAIAKGGAMAKARTGGVTADAFPTAAQLVGFLAACVRAELPFKVTAGLHHPLRDLYRLTYEPESPRSTMFGYLNVFLAAAFLRAGMDEETAQALLEERDPASIRLDDLGVVWRGHRLTSEAVADARRLGVRSFGSCSFREPVDELALLPIVV